MSKIITFFKKYQIIGIKSKYFEGFCMVAELIENKEHLKPEGLEKITTNQIGYGWVSSYFES